NTSVLFWNLIRSDGFTVDFLFKTKEDAVIDHHDLTLEDFSYEEITANYRPTFVDPGRKTILFSFYGPGMGESRLRLHQGRQRAADMMVIMLVDGGVKYDEVLRQKRRELDTVRGCSILVCKTCKILWNRDVNAAKNMMAISISVWKDKERPTEFSRKTTS
ncbi:hypothetical protein BDF20DRAFT_824659, partial [Mycotypha africana]|uniref:uncharacterized protein n=1 Tax=Mycotypha africana TaxID=64632 RepID=UPI0023008422